ncbi:beta-lactamase-like protein [Gaertneriomyces semiglobifer]|nr:beta-lactamase-like protein [Gaertneriomyces semiglobifer]
MWCTGVCIRLSGKMARSNFKTQASLSNNPQFPCTHIVFQHIPILLDASLELQFQRNVEQSQGGASMVSSGFASSLPLRMIMPGVSAIALEDVECLLISNCYNMLALPYITEYTQFRGKIYATGPTVEFGRLMMEELVHNFAINRQTGEPAYIVECDNEVRHLYSINDIERCMSKVNILRYDEFRDLRDGVCIVPRSSGFSLGAANWVIESPSGKVSYLAASSNSEFGHSRIIDTSPLSDVDAIITTQVCKPLEVPLWESLKVALDMIARSIQHHGNILIPVHPCGNMFELISIISQDLKARGFTETPMHVVSPVAKRSLQFANIQGEWMSKDRQMHIYEARHPLILNDLLEERLLHHHEHADSIFSYRGPYIVFVGHPSLIAGEFSKLFRRWKRDPRNLLRC